MSTRAALPMNARFRRAHAQIEPLESRIAPAALASYNLTDLNGANGFKLSGVALADYAGSSVSDAGDVNGDGFEDVIVGASYAPGGTKVGASYVVFGKATGWTANLNLSGLTGSDGFKLTGVAVDDKAGNSVSAAGDLNGDGFDDLIVGAASADANGTDSGAAYVVFGRASFTANLNLSSLTGSDGFRLSGAAGSDLAGISVSAAGDVNGDGFDDVILGARAATGAVAGTGAAYVVFGRTDFSPLLTAGTLSLGALNGTTGFKISGAVAGDVAGIAVGAVGDVNGDGFDDVIVSAAGADPGGISNAGAAYVVFGRASFGANVNLASLTGASTGFKVSGAIANEYTGLAVSGAGDVNGDGFDDLIVGAPYANPNGNFSGASYVIFGKGTAFADNLSLGSLALADGFKLSGGAAYASTGVSVSAAGDVNGDGFDELLVGGLRNGFRTGTSYVVFGKASGFANLTLTSLDGTNGFAIVGALSGDEAGRAVSTAGDVNGDGFDDLIIGAIGANGQVTDSGAAYVFFGFDTGAVTHLGGSGPQTLTSGANPSIFVAGTGDDTMLAGGPAWMRGGQGNDLLSLAALPFQRLHGGTGTDTLRLESSFPLTLDLTTLADNRLQGVEIIDLSSAGRHTLTLNLHEVLAISDESNTLRIDRDGGDTVNLGTGWTVGARQLLGGKVYETYTQGAATLLVQFVNVNLGSLTGGDGFRLSGAAAQDFAGYSVSDAGDVNGDGFGDVIVGATGADPNGGSSGASYVVFGKAGGYAANLDLSTLDGSNGFKLSGVAAGDQSGRSVSGAGDVNGDGFDDLLVGANGADLNGNYSGASYVIFGKATFASGNLNLSSLDGSNGFQISGAAAGDQSGFSMSGAGDVNGDGFDDLLVGAKYADPNGTSSGASYVIFGQASGWAPTFAVSSLANGDGSTGFQISGAAAGDYSGISVSGAGDVNGDGFGDLLVGANRADPNGNSSGASYVIFGRASGWMPTFPLSSLASGGSAGFQISGAAQDDQSGISVSGAGDVNGDGFDDLLVGAYGVELNGDRSGASYLIFGQASGFTTVDLGALGSAGFQLSGGAIRDYSGRSVSGAGDVNGDGFDDLLVGANGAAPNGDLSGASYVIFGKANGFGPLNLATLDASAGFQLSGAAVGDRSGRSVSTAGDVNGDGFDDLLIGAPNANGYAGAAYVVFGFDTGAVTHAGGAGAQTLTGTAGANVFVAGTGGDTMAGGGGADVFHGGEGADVLAIGDLTFRRLDGGLGSDTLRLDTAGARLDLTALRDNRLLGLEEIDLTGTGANRLVLDRHEVLALSGSTNTLLVRGNAGDAVTIEPGWTRGADETLGGAPFAVFTQGAATLKVAAAVSVSVNLQLGALSGPNGFRLSGAAAQDSAGRSVSDAGDVNGDGFGDVIVGAPGADPNGAYSGASYVVFGKAGGFAPNLDLSTLAGDGSGFQLSGVAAGDQSGISVSGAGDVNGDGFDDLIVGARYADPNGDDSGASYVIFGQASGWAPTFALSSLASGNGSAGFQLSGAAADDRSGFSVSGAGDVNGDGFDDLLVGAYKADPNGDASGASYVIFGQARGWAGTFALSSLASGDGRAGFQISGAAVYDNSGISVSGAGDVNGDGFDDLLVGAYSASPNGSASGASYVIFGRASFADTLGNLNLAMLSGSTGFRLSGVAVGDQSGISVSGAGDVNGDGFDDLLVGAWQADPNGNSSGASYVIFGQASGFTTVNLGALGSAGFQLSGGAIRDYSGRSVSGAGDVNGDGFDDLLVGAFGADPNGDRSGASYVIFGKANGFGPLNLATLDASAGFQLSGAAVFDKSGQSVSTAGDVNGDGFDDLLIGAPNANGYAGAAYVVFGFDTAPAVADTLSGDGGPNVLIGGTGADVLTGGGGLDVLRGGQGDDVLSLAGLPFARLQGGTGTDTLRLEGGGFALDLTTLPDNRLSGFERIDLTAPGAHHLTLDRHEVLALSGSSNTLRVDGTAADTVQLAGLGWTLASVTGGYRIFTDGAARLEVAQAVATPGPLRGLNLGALTGGDGFRLSGGATNDLAGFSVSDAGDVNGDGYGDVIVGAPGANGSAGASYVVFGKAGGFTANLDLSTLAGGDGSTGFQLTGAAGGDFSGGSVSGAGDVNGDGFGDLIVGAYAADPNGSSSGASTVVFGHAGSFGTTLDLATLTPSTGFRLSGGAAGDYAGFSVSRAGDVNGDGFDDLIVGAFRVDPNGTDSGASYVLFGRASGLADLNLAALNGSNGFRLSGGAAGDYSGRSVSGAGDVNGDGFDDLIVGAPYADANGTNSGASYVVFGRAGGFAANLDLAMLTGSAGFRLGGSEAGDYSGFSVSGAGDVNGDGFDDLIVGAYRASANGAYSGASYVIFGKASGLTDLNLGSLTAADGFRLSGGAAGDASGISVSGAGDVNGDGFDDLLVGAYGAGPNGFVSGASYVIFGKASGLTTLNLATLDGSAGFQLSGAAAFDRSGRSVSTAGDVNGDGFDDLLIGAPNVNGFTGAAYVVFGFDTGAVTHPGDATANTLTGTSGADVLIGGQLGDTLIAGGGADVLHGGQGDDVLVIISPDFLRLDGGTGSNTLKLDADAFAFDLTALADNRVHGFTTIDLGSPGAQAITLDVREVFRLSDHSNTVTVEGTGDDFLNIGAGWTRGAVASGYTTFTQGAATLKVASAVKITQIAPTITIDDVSVLEGNGTLVNFAFTVRLSSASIDPVTVDFVTADGTAIAPGDYAPTRGTLTFASGETSQTISVPIFPDTMRELGADETFTMNLSAPTGATLADAQGLGTILNDDAAPANVLQLVSGKAITFLDANNDKVTVKLTGPGAGTLTLDGGLLTGADISEIALGGTTTKSSLSVTVKKDKALGDGFVSIGEVTVGGSLNAFNAKAADFADGGLRATGVVKSLTAHHLAHGEVMTAGAATDKLALTFANVAGGTLIQTGETIAKLTATALGADVAALTSAIGAITVKAGALSGDVTAQSFGAVKVTGGDFSGSITALATAATLGKIKAVKSLTVTNGDLTGDVSALGVLGAINVKSGKNKPGGNVTGATIYGSALASFAVARNVTGALVLAGADLGDDHVIGGANDTFAGGTIGSVKIGGNVTGATVIAAGLSTDDAIFKDGDDVVLGGTASVVKSFAITGTADADSYFVAGVFKAAPKIAKVKVPLPDPRFKTA